MSYKLSNLTLSESIGRRSADNYDGFRHPSSDEHVDISSHCFHADESSSQTLHIF
jgi:hypothetical protein